jgi:hypothetical protein
MALEFQKISDQIYRMGAMIENLDFDQRENLRIAKERFWGANDMDLIKRRIELVRQSSFSGYRGAAALDEPYTEAINKIYPAPETPSSMTIIAADGSQIYPNERSPVHFYLLNIGLYVYHHGVNHLPEQITYPTLAYHSAYIHDDNKRLVTNRTVDARRTVAEMEALAEKAWEMRKLVDHPLIALYDNKLLFWVTSEVSGSKEIEKKYHAAMTQLYDVQANGTRTTLAGYVDSPQGSVVLRLLHLLSLASDDDIKIKQHEIRAGGDLEGLRDVSLFWSILRPGERSALMVQNSPSNFEYKKLGADREIAFFYIKVGDETKSNIARVDVPMWVARDEDAINDLHAILLEQSTMQGRNPYPYALTRADELAYVGGKDKAKLDEMINIELRRKGIDPVLYSAKARGKQLARSDRQSYEMNTDIR